MLRSLRINPRKSYYLSESYRSIKKNSYLCSTSTSTSTVPKNTDKIISTSESSVESNKPLFNKILIANRGEIAVRIIKTAKKLGIKTVAVYSEPDAKSMHVAMADEAYCIGKAASKDSYLNMDKIISIAQYSNSQAIHPGYGFLSENAAFVDKVEAAGLIFIGPSSYPMTQMGDKINSKKIAENAGCFIIPGYQGEVVDEHAAVKIANESIGYPVMIKASAGGGGKGMRIAYNESEVIESFKLSKSEAMSSFGDDRMLMERYIEEPHHIEIQVLADQYGNVVAFPERECSIQRRNQKVIEESPSCFIFPATRIKMQKQAIQLCKAVNYRSAGTVEMLADKHQNFYFLEMNTRLQVEHPITELVTGEDLVEHMLRIAAGQSLPQRLLTQTGEVTVAEGGKKEDYQYGLLNPTGWAFESRVYAEDPLRGFLPSIGPLVTYIEPTSFTHRDQYGLTSSRLIIDSSGMSGSKGEESSDSAVAVVSDVVVSALSDDIVSAVSGAVVAAVSDAVVNAVSEVSKAKGKDKGSDTSTTNTTSDTVITATRDSKADTRNSATHGEEVTTVCVTADTTTVISSIDNDIPTNSSSSSSSSVSFSDTSSDSSPLILTRIDTGVREGDTISMYYDPMICKLCTYAPTRSLALQTMNKVLDEYVIINGVTNNLSFLRSIFRNENFIQGLYNTKFIACEYPLPVGFSGVQLDELERVEIMAGAVLMHISRLQITQSIHLDSNRHYNNNSSSSSSRSSSSSSRSSSGMMFGDSNLKKKKKKNKLRHNNSHSHNRQVQTFVVVMSSVDYDIDEGKENLYSVAISQTTDDGDDDDDDDEISVEITPLQSSSASSSSLLLKKKNKKVIITNWDWKCEQPLARVAFRHMNDDDDDDVRKNVLMNRINSDGDIDDNHSNTKVNNHHDNYDDDDDEVIQYIGCHSQLSHPPLHHHTTINNITTTTSSNTTSNTTSKVIPTGAGEIYYLNYHGATSSIEIRTVLEHKLARFIIPPEIIDTSKYVVSPMPGNLIAVNVSEGESVEVGQALFTVEAMKMQNVLRSTKKGTIRHLKAAVGDNLKVDQVICEYE